MEKLQSDRNAGIFLTSTDTKVQLKIVMQQPQKIKKLKNFNHNTILYHFTS